MKLSIAIIALVFAVPADALFGLGRKNKQTGLGKNTKKNDPSNVEPSQWVTLPPEFTLGEDTLTDQLGVFSSDGSLNLYNDHSGKSKLHVEIESLAIQSVANEVEKFGEALRKVTADRVHDYLTVKVADEKSRLSSAKMILASQPYRDILDENLQIFKQFYTEQIRTFGNTFAKQEADQVAKLQSEGVNMQVKASQKVDEMHEKIFENNLPVIKDYMSVAILEVQVYLDQYDFSGAFPVLI